MKKITMNVDTVLPALLQVCSVVASKNSIAILSDVIIKSFKRDTDENLSVMLCTSDGDQWLYVKSELIDGCTDFETAVNASDLLKVLSGLAGHVVTLEINEDKTLVNGFYENGEFSLPFDKSDEFPKPVYGESTETFDVITSSEKINKAISLTEDAATPDLLRPIMNGIHFDFFADRMVGVALSSSRFAKYTDMTLSTNTDKVVGCTMPSKACRVLSKVLSKDGGDVKMSFNDSKITVSNLSFRLVVSQNEGNYPPYDRLLNFEHKIHATVSKEDIVKAVKRVITMSSSTSVGVRFTLGQDTLTVSAEDVNFSKSASEHVKCDYQGEDFSVAMNGSSFLMMVQNIDDDNIVMCAETFVKPVLVSGEIQKDGEEYLTLIMPILLN